MTRFNSSQMPTAELPLPIASVVGESANKEMARVYAKRGVTGMANDHSVWNLAAKKLIRNAVSEQIHSIQADEPVLVTVLTTLPEPTRPTREHSNAKEERLYTDQLSFMSLLILEIRHECLFHHAARQI